MKRAILLVIFVGAVIGGGVFWLRKRGDEAKPGAENATAEKPEAKEPEAGGTRTSLDTNGNVVITMDDETQGNIGIKVAKPAAIQLRPELKAYGRVLDPTPLAALMMELAADRAASVASSNELARLKTLAGQGNTSTRALQSGEAAALRDQLAVDSVMDRLALGWGKAMADQKAPPGLIRALTSQEAALIRVDLPAGEMPAAAPASARVVKLTGSSVEAELLGPAPNIDLQTQGQGFIFLVTSNAVRLLPGEAVTGYVKVPGDPWAGVVIPPEAVVRTEGSGWVYVLTGGGGAFTRMRIDLDRPVETGWFIAKNISGKDYVVVVGAQTLLSEELKASIKAD